MTRGVTPEAFTLEDERQAALLSDPASVRYFRPFVARERSASAAAREVGCRLDTMLYRIKQFRAAGLLEQTGLEPRAGRPIKLYRSSHDAYFIPFELTPYTDLEAQLRERIRAQEDLIVRQIARSLQSGGRGRRLFRDARGEVAEHGAQTSRDVRDISDVTRGPAAGLLRPAEIFWDELLLTDAEAGELLQTLYALWQANKRGGDGRRKPYLLQVAIVPGEAS